MTSLANACNWCAAAPAIRCISLTVTPHEDYALLTTAPSIGQTLAAVIVLETGTIERFASAGNFASYAVTRGSKSRKGYRQIPVPFDFLGAEEDRTPDLRIANATLSQLSYVPGGATL